MTLTQHRPQKGTTPEALARYLRAVDYLAAAQVYLKSNPLLREPLKAEHIKDRLLGHWGTCPGINLVVAHLNQLILKTDASMLLVTGPGHGAAANMANMWIEGTLTEYYPQVTRDAAGMELFLRRFSWPYGFPSHLSPALPGVIHEGGELGYALATAYGAVLDNPDLIAACIVGDGEAETGPTAGAWHSAKFINPRTDGAVLPILHLNGFKIANPTLFATMTDNDLETLFSGYGHAVRICGANDVGEALQWAYDAIRKIQKEAPERARWPLVILKTPKGMGCPAPFEGTHKSHQVPVKDPKGDAKDLAMLEKWLRSYKPEELFDTEGRPHDDIVAACPQGDKRIAVNPHTFGGRRRVPLKLPHMHSFAVDVQARGAIRKSHMENLGRYLAEVIKRNEPQRNFRIVCPDELESNRLGAVLSVTSRQYNWPTPAGTENTTPDGRVLEVLSEHNCQGWLQGYLLTGRHGLFPCYEAFLPIVDGMMNQYAKFLKASSEAPWREPVSSLNYILTSEAWRQDHNGYSHQGPGFINNALTKKGETYRIYLPPDANTLLSTMEHCLESTNYINLIIAGKQPMPQWLSMDEAIEHCRVGTSIWRWASTFEGESPDVVLGCCGDNLTLETMAAAALLREEVPTWRIRVVNTTDLMSLGIPQKYPHGLSADRFDRIFPPGVPVLYSFHGYTSAIKQLLWERPDTERFDINGYREEGSTTTPFDMHVRNRTSRYHIVIGAARMYATRNPGSAAGAESLIRKYEEKLRKHSDYAAQFGVDPPEIADWVWPT